MKRKILSLRFVLSTSLFFVLVLPCSVALASSAAVQLKWNANRESDIAGYRLHYGYGERNYTRRVDVGKNTSHSVSDLEPGKPCYFAVTAYNNKGESNYSNEVFFTGTNTPPTAIAGPDQTVGSGVLVTLDGNGSSDPDDGISSYYWQQTLGPPVTIAKPTAAKTVFISPNVGSNEETLAFALTVSDHGGLENEDACVIQLSGFVVDSDEDGISDDDEISIYGTDPANPDTDGDGIGDGDEIIEGTDPTGTNSDPKPVVFAVNAAGPTYQDGEGVIFRGDTNYTGGMIQYMSAGAVGGTNDDTLYESQRCGDFSYNIPVSKGTFMVTFKFAEYFHRYEGRRIFDVKVEGSEVISDMDLFSEAGIFQAYDLTVPVTATDGTLNISFHSERDSAVLNAIKIEQESTIMDDLGYGWGGTTSSVQKIWIEAQDGYLTAPMGVYRHAEASFTKYIEVPNGAGSGGSAEYFFEIPKTGEYVIWGRVISNGYGDNSFNVSVDDGNRALWDTPIIKNTWIWDQVNDRNVADPVVYYLQAGQHTLTIDQREDGTKLDRILITNDLEYVPDK